MIKHPCEYRQKFSIERTRRTPICGKGGRQCVVMGITTDVTMNLCSQHRDILGREHRVYSAEAYQSLQPRTTAPAPAIAQEFKLE